jgi:hypothetical protein
VPTYTVVATSVDGGGTVTFPAGTIFPAQADPEYDQTAQIVREREILLLEGIFQEATEQLNFTRFFDLMDFVNTAGRVRIEIKLGGSNVRVLEPHSRGPLLRNLRLIQRPGALATHAHFTLEVDDTREPDETKGVKDASGLKRIRRQQFYDGRHQQTTWTIRATGRNAKELVEKFRPPDSLRAKGALTSDELQQVDEQTWEQAHTFEAAQKPEIYLTWERRTTVAEGGSTIEEIPILGPSGPVLRKGQIRAHQVTDESTFTTLGRWKEVFGTRPGLLFSDQFRDPTRSDRSQPFLIVDARKDIWRKSVRDFYLVPPDVDVKGQIAAALSDVLPASGAAPDDPTGWTEIENQDEQPDE